MIPACFSGIHGDAGTAHIPVVLHVAVEVVRDLVVDVDVVHLANWKSSAVKTAAVHRRNAEAAVIGDHKAIGIGGIDPDIVRVSAPRDIFEVLAAVHGPVEGTAGHEK